MESVQLFVVLLAVFALPLALGQYLARSFRMPEQGWRIATVFFSLFAAAAVTYFGWPPKLGIDLRGGSQLVYEVDQTQRQSEAPVDMSKLIEAVQKRIDPDGVQEITIRPYGLQQIEIIIPDTDSEELERIKNRISSTGLLEFRITANDRQHKDLIERAKRLDAESNVLYGELSDGTKEEEARWVPMKSGIRTDSSWITRKVGDGKDARTDVLVVKDQQDVNGGLLKGATAAVSDKGNGYKVDFRFGTKGARLFGKLTGDNLPVDNAGQMRYSNLAIILDGQLESAPTINSMITDSGEISGSFTQEQAEDLAKILTAGSLPTALNKEPSTSLTTGPTLGADTIRKGVNAMLVATIAVIVFMVVYYRFAGLVANFALLLNVLLIVAFMIIFRAAFTLSGLAGLALTVGMAVDANVLIYERMREELAKNATLRMAIRNGFERATTTIIDANVTTLISAIVLYVIGTDQVKGFAITLILGILMNLYTAIFVSRVIFDIAEKTRFIKQLNMLHILSNPNFEFISKWKIATAVSVVIIVAGFVGVFERGKGILDIDFTGGTSVQLLFAEPIGIAKVREDIEERRDDLPDATVQDVQILEEKPGIRFVINTSNNKKSDVEQVLRDVFKDKLKTNQFETVGQIALITELPGRKAVESPAGAPKPDVTKPESPKSETPQPDGSKPETPAKSPETEAPKSDAPAAEPAAEPATEPSTEPAKEPAAEPSIDQPAAPDAPQSRANERFRPEDAGLLALADAQDTTGPAAPEEKTPAPTDKGTPAKPTSETKGALPAEAPEATISTPSRLIGGSQVELKFGLPIGPEELLDILNMARAATPGVDQTAVFDVDKIESDEKTSGKKTEDWTVRTSLSKAEFEGVLKQANDQLEHDPIFPESSQIGAKVADNTKRQAAMAMAASLVLILAYVWFRFSQVMFGVAAVLAVIHDVLVTLGAIALSYWLANIPGFEYLLVEPFKISLPIIAAFLTIIGYSLNDTIVIFDRIREARGKSPNITPELANRCINETLSRTILTSLTVFIVVLILYIAGGQAIHGFAFAMVVGVLAGSYSTIYIATPIVLWMNRHSSDEKVPAVASGKKISQRTSPA